MFMLHCVLLMAAFGCGLGFHDAILAKMASIKASIMAKL